MAVNLSCLLAFCLLSLLLISGVNSREDEEEFETSDICQQKPDPGMCMAYFPRWYFNTTLNKCVKFIYGGCQGNQNRFETKGECKMKCLHANDKQLLQSSFDEQEERQEPSSTHQDEKEQQSLADEHVSQEPPCNVALIHKLKKMERMSAIEKLKASILVGGVPRFHPKYVPICDEEGYYAPMQCMRDMSECWCVDRLGNEIENSRKKRARGKSNRLNCS